MAGHMENFDSISAKPLADGSNVLLVTHRNPIDGFAERRMVCMAGNRQRGGLYQLSSSVPSQARRLCWMAAR